MTANLLFRAGDLDLARIAAWLDARPDVFEARGSYLICGAPATADMMYRAALENPQRLPNAVTVALRPREIVVQQESASADKRRSCWDFARWLTDTFDVTAVGDGDPDYNADVTEAIRSHGIDSAFDEQTRRLPLAWAGFPIELGWFGDLPHGRDTNITVAQARRAAASPGEPHVLAYLRAGRLYRESNAIAVDVIDGSTKIGPAHLHSDGVYVWPADLPYYVERYHVRLPRHFMIHARDAGWQIAAPTRCTLVIGDVALGARIRHGSGDEVRSGYLLSDPDARVLATLTTRHDGYLETLANELRLDGIAGIAPMQWLGAVPPDCIGYDDVLVERCPPGRPASELAPIAEAAVIRIGAAIAEVLATAHAKAKLVHVMPELVFVDRDHVFTGLVPRGPIFIASAPQPYQGPRSYMVPYEPFEVLAQGRPSSAAGDVFALCATLHVLATGNHPFGDASSFGTIITRVIADRRDPYPGTRAFGDLLARGMSRDHATRPTARELADRFAKLLP